MNLDTSLLLTFNDFLLLLFWLISITFAAYILSRTAIFFPRFITSLTQKYKHTRNYDRDYDLIIRPSKTGTPVKKEMKKNHGRTIPFFNKR